MSSAFRAQQPLLRHRTKEYFISFDTEILDQERRGIYGRFSIFRGLPCLLDFVENLIYGDLRYARDTFFGFFFFWRKAWVFPIAAETVHLMNADFWKKMSAAGFYFIRQTAPILTTTEKADTWCADCGGDMDCTGIIGNDEGGVMNYPGEVIQRCLPGEIDAGYFAYFGNLFC